MPLTVLLTPGLPEASEATLARYSSGAVCVAQFTLFVEAPCWRLWQCCSHHGCLELARQRQAGTFGGAAAGHEGREAVSGRFNFGGQQGDSRGGRGDSSDSDEGVGFDDDEFSDGGGVHEDAEAKAERLSKVAGGSGREEGGDAGKQQQQQQQQRGRRRAQQQQQGLGQGVGGQQQQSAEDEAALLAALEAAGVQTEGVALPGASHPQQQQQHHEQQIQAEHLAARAASASGSGAAKSILAGTCLEGHACPFADYGRLAGVAAPAA
eukprot:1161798-Pelagomonas_calceolata.AAC.13